MSYVQGKDGVWREPPGYAALWLWFGLSYAAWLTMPRVLMHEMPDDWQQRMADLLREYDDHWNLPDCGITSVRLRRNGKFVPMPGWIAYRHPDKATINAFRASPSPQSEELGDG